jgi:hypothetical protein
MREAARTFRARQEAKGLSQAVFWMTHRQAHEVREWLYAGGDISIFTQGKESDHG